MKEIVEIKQRSLAEENQKALEIIKERYPMFCHENLDAVLFSLICWMFSVLFYQVNMFLVLPLASVYIIFLVCREQALQDQLRQAQESVSTMQKLHELAQSQLFEVRAQSGFCLVSLPVYHIFSFFLLLHITD